MANLSTDQLEDTTANFTGHYYDHYYDWEDYVYREHFYPIFPFEVPVYGYIWPALVLFTSCCNLLVIGAFLRKRMRNSTNVILISIAISDSLTGLVTLPAAIYIYVHENELLTDAWCNGAMITRLYISRAFHTVSVWQTLLLAVHRYLHIRFPLKAERYCHTKNTAISIGIIYFLAFVLHIYHAFDTKAAYGFCQWVLPNPCGWACVYIWCALFLGHLLPCLVLVIIAVLMIRGIRELRHSQVELQINSRRHENRNVTIVVILIVTIFLIPDLPYGIFYLTTLCLKHSDKDIFPLETNRIIHCVYELLLVVSFHLNFWVYCVMYRHFRSWVKGLLRLVTCKSRDEESRSGEQEVELAGMTTILDQSRDEDVKS